MLYYLIIAVFVLTIAVTSGSIVITSQLRIAYKSDFFGTLMYFLVFYFTFGFYALWGQMLISSFLSGFVTQALLERITDIMVLFGSPFLVFASLMFIRFMRDLTGRKTSNSFAVGYIIFHLLLIAGLGLALVKNPDLNALKAIRYYFIALSFLYTGAGAYFALFPRKKPFHPEADDLKKLAVGLFVLMMIHNTLMLLYDSNIILALLFIFSYFMYGGFIPVFLKYGINLLPKSETNDAFHRFCEQYAISSREQDIINEICMGLTNQQIADKLFISLQTVKDHTHRIYSKTECASRVQLIRKVNENSQVLLHPHPVVFNK